MKVRSGFGLSLPASIIRIIGRREDASDFFIISCQEDYAAYYRNYRYLAELHPMILRIGSYHSDPGSVICRNSGPVTCYWAPLNKVMN